MDRNMTPYEKMLAEMDGLKIPCNVVMNTLIETCMDVVRKHAPVASGEDVERVIEAIYYHDDVTITTDAARAAIAAMSRTSLGVTSVRSEESPKRVDTVSPGQCDSDAPASSPSEIPVVDYVAGARKRIKPSTEAQKIRAALAFDIDRDDSIPDYVWDIVDLAAQLGMNSRTTAPERERLAPIQNAIHASNFALENIKLKRELAQHNLRPASVSLEKCAKAAYAKRISQDSFYEFDIAKAVLEAAGVAYD